MPGTKTRLFLILLASVGVPYVWFNDYWQRMNRSGTASLHGSGSGSPGLSILGETDRYDAESYGRSQHQAAPALAPQSDLADVLRFDISPDWVTERWPRVSTIRAEKDLEGLRVPLVTGKALDDVAGSLTYYFDRERHIQRISFHGHTGDERKLLSVVAGKYSLQSEPSLGAGMYVARWNARPTSVLRVSYAPVVRADSPHTRLQVSLEINRPNMYYGLSREFADMLHRDHATNRW